MAPNALIIFMTIYLITFNLTPLQSGTIYANSGNIGCDGGDKYNTCQNDILQCSSGRICNIYCDKNNDRRRLLSDPFAQYIKSGSSRNLLWSCESEDGGCCGATANCPAGYACNIDCNYACHGLTVNAEQSSTVTISNCDNCNQMTINCPKNGRGPIDGRCTLEIEADISQLQVYAEESFYDFRLQYGYGDTLLGSTLYCGSSGQHSCTLYSDGTTCTQANHICIDYRIPTTSPTNDPTTQPTNIPTTGPTKQPTTPPTPAPTTVPSVSPTKYPTVLPSDAPTSTTAAPTTFPSKSPTLPSVSPTTYPTRGTTSPTHDPTYDPTTDPTTDPSVDPTTDPTNDPTTNPTYVPSDSPTPAPSLAPSMAPTDAPTRPEGHVEENTVGGESGDDELTVGGNRKTGLDTWIYIVIGCVLCLCCLVLLVIIGKKRVKSNIEKGKRLNYLGSQDNALAHTSVPMEKVNSVSILTTSKVNSEYEGGATTINNNEDMDVFNGDEDDMIIQNMNMMTPNGNDAITPMVTPMVMSMDIMENVILNGVAIVQSIQEGTYHNNNNPLLQMNGIQEGTYQNNINPLTPGGPVDDFDEVDNIDNDVNDVNDVNNDDDIIVTAGGPVQNEMDDDGIDAIDNDIDGQDVDDDMVNINTLTVGGPLQNNNDNEIDDINNNIGDIDNDDEVIGDSETLEGGDDDDNDDIDVVNGINTAMGDEIDYDEGTDEDDDVFAGDITMQ